MHASRENTARNERPDRQRLAARCLAALWLGLMSLAVAADEVVNEAVQAFLYEQARELGDEIVIDIYPSSALLPPCEAPQVFLPRAGTNRQWGRISVGVRCGENAGSVRYLQAQVAVIGDYVRLTDTVEPGVRIEAHMLEIGRGDLSQLAAGTLLGIEDAIGQIARQRLPAGSALQSRQLRKPALVQRGQRVSVAATGPGFQVLREGQALEAGGLGDSIRVSLSRNESLHGVVSGNGTVTVAFQ